MAKVVGEYAVHGVLDEDGVPHSFLPGVEVPGWAAKQMGAHCFEGGEDIFNEDGVPKPVVHHDAILANPLTVEVDGPPPQSGKGSGVRAWRAYAEAHDVDAEGLDVDDIVAKLEAAGVPVE